MTERLFAGLKVIDCASWIAGPAAATILSDFGADVIKIEPPGAGDPWRASSPVPGRTTDYYWQLTSRNKRSLAIDLKQADGLAVLYRLLGAADVFVTNFPLPVRKRLKIGADDVLPLNPRLIYASFSAYGEAGDEAAHQVAGAGVGDVLHDVGDVHHRVAAEHAQPVVVEVDDLHGALLGVGLDCCDDCCR